MSEGQATNQQTLELSKDERRRACAVAASIVEARQEQYKPERPKLEGKGKIRETVFCGVSGDELVCAISLEWGRVVVGSIYRTDVTLHVRLRVVQTAERGRVLRPVSMHLPQYTNGAKPCLICGPAFDERDVIQEDTSRWEY